MNTEHAPIVLFVYSRVWHTEQTLRALQANDLADASVLYVYSDSPKHMATQEDIAAVEAVRDLVKREAWCKEVHLVEAPHNRGLVTSFVTGITDVVNRHGRAIVLEDDQVSSKGFLRFMNQALEIYKDDSQVMHVSGYMYPADFESAQTTFFLQIQSCPGWGTWKRAWDLYDHDCKGHLDYFSRSRLLRRKFDIEGHAYYYRQLVRNGGNELYSWAVRWHASCIRAGGLSLFPARSLVKNIGCDDTGEHCTDTTMYDVETVDDLPIERVPIVEDQAIRRRVDAHYRKHLRRGLIDRLTNGQHPLRLIRSRLLTILRAPFRLLVRFAYPELQQLDVDLAREIGLYSFQTDCTLASSAKAHRPYRLTQCEIGDYSFVMPDSRMSKTCIGKFSSIGPRFTAGGGLVPTDGVSMAPMFYALHPYNGVSMSGTNKCAYTRPIRIGNDVWIGMNVTVLDGVIIGDGAVIGAGCVVSKDVAPYAVVVGNPMKVLRDRCDASLRERLQNLQWWDWSGNQLGDVEQHIFDAETFLECQEKPGREGSAQ